MAGILPQWAGIPVGSLPSWRDQGRKSTILVEAQFPSRFFAGSRRGGNFSQSESQCDMAALARFWQDLSRICGGIPLTYFSRKATCLHLAIKSNTWGVFCRLNFSVLLQEKMVQNVGIQHQFYFHLYQHQAAIKRSN